MSSVINRPMVISGSGTYLPRPFLSVEDDQFVKKLPVFKEKNNGVHRSQPSHIESSVMPFWVSPLSTPTSPPIPSVLHSKDDFFSFFY